MQGKRSSYIRAMSDVTAWSAPDRAATLNAAPVLWEQLVGEHGGLVSAEAERLRAARADEDVAGVVDALHAAGRTLAAACVPPTHGTGVVVQLNVSDGGVPKKPVDEVQVGGRGIVGDRQASRKHHGRPFQALCLWSAEVIERLAAEGHPIAPGLAGENVTVSGIDWAGLRAGVRLRIGSVVAETSAWSIPCKKNAPWFLKGDFNRMHQDREPGVSRIYTWVVEPGAISVGDEVVIEP